MAYWLSHAALCCFGQDKVSKKLTTREGMTTADNDRFLRSWSEIVLNKIFIGCTSINDAKTSHKKWFPYNKGGSNRRWYGNNELIVNWENDGLETEISKMRRQGVSDPIITMLNILSEKVEHGPQYVWRHYGTLFTSRGVVRSKEQAYSLIQLRHCCMPLVC